MALLAAGALLLGFLGFWDANPTRSLSDDLYLALSLFPMQSGDNYPGPELCLEVARYLAPFVALYAAIRAVVTLLTEGTLSWRVRFLRNHAVFAGAGSHAVRLIEECRKRRLRVVVIQDAAEKAEIQHKGIYRLEVNSMDAAALARARVRHARYFFALSPSDSANLDAANDASALLECPGAPPLAWRGYVHVEHRTMRDVYRAGPAQGFAAQTGRLNIFSASDLTARSALAAHPLELRPDQSVAPMTTLTLVGFDHLAESLLMHAARIAHYRSGIRLRVRIVDHHQSRSHSLSARHPNLTEVVDLEIVELHLHDPRFVAVCLEGLPQGTDAMNTVCVCLPDEPSNLDIAFGLLRSPTNMPLRVLMRPSHYRRVGKDLSGHAAATREFALLAGAAEIWTWEMVVDEDLDVMARAAHHDYVEMRRKRPRDKQDDPKDLGLLDWEFLAEDLRDSNRQQADHLWVKLQAIGITKRKLNPAEIQNIEFTVEEVDVLARMEHARWIAERRLAGWRYAAGKDVANRLNPYLVPFDDLPPEIKEYDREIVRRIPFTLAATRR
jgi:hypothetical protein